MLFRWFKPPKKCDRTDFSKKSATKNGVSEFPALFFVWNQLVLRYEF